MISNVLQIKNLQKGFKDTQVVNLSSLSVQQGEIYGFLGPNGAGKTTTMKMILSLISRTAGEIEVFGQSIGTDKQYLNQIGSMIEEPSYYPNLTGYENLLVFQKILGFDKKNIQETLKIVGLDQPKNKKKLVKDYSLGMKQRLALAFADSIITRLFQCQVREEVHEALEHANPVLCAIPRMPYQRDVLLFDTSLVVRVAYLISAGEIAEGKGEIVAFP